MTGLAAGAWLLAGVAAAGETHYAVLDHLVVVRLPRSGSDNDTHQGSSNRLTSGDIAAAQQCKDLGPASKVPDEEAAIINNCLRRNGMSDVQVVTSDPPIKAVLR